MLVSQKKDNIIYRQSRKYPKRRTAFLTSSKNETKSCDMSINGAILYSKVCLKLIKRMNCNKLMIDGKKNKNTKIKKI